MIEAGEYVVRTKFGSVIVAHLKPSDDASHYVDEIIAGPYHDDKPIAGMHQQSGYRKAFQALIEFQKRG